MLSISYLLLSWASGEIGVPLHIFEWMHTMHFAACATFYLKPRWRKCAPSSVRVGFLICAWFFTNLTKNLFSLPTGFCISYFVLTTFSILLSVQYLFCFFFLYFLNFSLSSVLHYEYNMQYRHHTYNPNWLKVGSTKVFRVRICRTCFLLQNFIQEIVLNFGISQFRLNTNICVWKIQADVFR